MKLVGISLHACSLLVELGHKRKLKRRIPEFQEGRELQTVLRLNRYGRQPGHYHNVVENWQFALLNPRTHQR
jgi:hypothetical protein